ncbi:MAG: DNA repair protein RecO [Phycisphaeraceae bacterium]|nr:DNA repair protein RecO [Phycisphaeraceae bacterium]
MASFRDECVCIGAWDWSETSQTVRLLARRHGLIRGLAKGSRREPSNFHGGFEPLTRGESIISPKPPPGLSNVTSWTLVEIFPAVRSDLASFHIGMYAADLIAHVIIDADPHPELYDSLIGLLRQLVETARTDAALLRFQWSVLEHTGHRPELDADVAIRGPLSPAGAYVFDSRLGGVRADSSNATQGAWRIRHTTLEALRQARAGGHIQGLAVETVRRASRLLHVYAREILGRETPAARFLFGDSDAS